MKRLIFLMSIMSLVEVKSLFVYAEDPCGRPIKVVEVVLDPIYETIYLDTKEKRESTLEEIRDLKLHMVRELAALRAERAFLEEEQRKLEEEYNRKHGIIDDEGSQ